MYFTLSSRGVFGSEPLRMSRSRTSTPSLSRDSSTDLRHHSRPPSGLSANGCPLGPGRVISTPHLELMTTLSRPGKSLSASPVGSHGQTSQPLLSPPGGSGMLVSPITGSRLCNLIDWFIGSQQLERYAHVRLPGVLPIC
jgi:hypothetical protein